MRRGAAPASHRPVAPARVLMTTDTLGGVWNYSIELARALRQCDTSVVLATMGAPLVSAQRREAASIPNLRIFESAFKLEWMNDPWADVERAADWLLHLEDCVRPALVHLNGYCHARLRWRVPILLTAHSCVLSWWSAVKHDRAPSQWDRYRDEVTAGLNAADAVAAPTHAMLSSLRRHYRWSGRAEVIPNGRAPEAFAPVSKQPFMLCAGRLWDEAKNLGLVGRAASALPWPVYAAGANTHPQGGDARAPSIRLLGQLAPDDLARWMAAASVFVAPARYEPFGLAILEAALCGCALILGDIESLRENWDGAAVFVSTEDAQDLIDAARDLTTHPARLGEMQQKARQRALHFSRTRMLTGYLRLYSDLIRKSASAQAEIAG
jgi:glycogen(starch) synthase